MDPTNRMKWMLSTTTTASLLLVAGCSMWRERPQPTAAAHPVPAPVAKQERAPEPPSRRTLPKGAEAPLFSDLGDYSYPITTKSELAQRYFDQGLTLAYGFNHAEAARSFRECHRLDPNAAMCAWGEAYVLGPNINKPMEEADVEPAWKALQAALDGLRGVSPKEQAMVRALAKRYTAKPVSDRKPLDRAYAEAMRKVAKAYPDDVDVQTLFAEALMDTMPWDYYEKNGKPKPATVEAVNALEAVMRRVPNHAGAIHFYIHAVEASSTPERAEAPADRLADLVPGAGHLVHMPSHIYIRLGRYNDATEANDRAAKSDEAYIAQCKAQGFYPAMYYPHNLHFQWASANFEGRSGVALDVAKKIVDFIPPERAKEFPFLQEVMPIHLYTLARFGRWQEILAAPGPDVEFRYAKVMWHYSRGMALAAGGELEEALKEHGLVAAAADSVEMKSFGMLSVGATGTDLLRIAASVLEGNIAEHRKDWKVAIRAYEEATRRQDALPYSEPPPWYFPVRDALGRAYLGAGRPTEAEAVFRKQLELTPRNGWTLYGLAASLKAQGKNELADDVGRQFAKAWEKADVKLESSVF